MTTLTGADGFIGSHVLALENPLPKRYFMINQVVDLKSGTDICHMQATCDVVIHLAAVSSIPNSFKDPEETMRTNILGLTHVIELCKENNSRLIFASSSSVNDPQSPYAYSKLWGEELIKQSGLSYAILRFGNVYGEGDGKSAIHHFINDKIITINGDGEQTRSFIYAGDLAGMIKHYAKNKKQGTFNLGGEELSIKEVASYFNKPVQHGPARKGDAQTSGMVSDWAVKTRLKDWLSND